MKVKAQYHTTGSKEEFQQNVAARLKMLHKRRLLRMSIRPLYLISVIILYSLYVIFCVVMFIVFVFWAPFGMLAELLYDCLVLPLRLVSLLNKKDKIDRTRYYVVNDPNNPNEPIRTPLKED